MTVPMPPAEPSLSGKASAGDGKTPDMATVTVQFPGSGERWRAEIPAGPVNARVMLPVFRALADTVVDQAVQAVRISGETISCQKGCGACCRQLVPISPLEARRLGELVEELPAPRRAEIRRRFAEARQKLAAAGLLDRLLYPERFSNEELRPLGVEYFQEKIPCPFLDDESCSIYADRPIACREYLVTSPAEHCSRPSADTVRRLPLPGKVSNAVTRLEEKPGARFIPWVPLILAPEWAETHPDETPPRPGPEILRELFQRLAGKMASK